MKKKSFLEKYLNKIVKVIIDRPLGSKHPHFNWNYPVNYGYLPNTKAADGEEIDAYVLGINGSVKEFKGKVIAIIHRVDDDDDKLVVTPKEIDFSNEEIKNLTDFQEQYFDSKIIKNI